MAMAHLKIVVEKHDDGYVAYPVGVRGVIVGQGETYEEAVNDVKSAFHAETFGKMRWKGTQRFSTRSSPMLKSRSDAEVSGGRAESASPCVLVLSHSSDLQSFASASTSRWSVKTPTVLEHR